MMHIHLPIYLVPLFLSASLAGAVVCRNTPGDPGYPPEADWTALNASVSGRLVNVIPSAKFCESQPSGTCTTSQWTSAVFRSNIPGAMNQVNWEQDYVSNPPSLCLRNGSTCGQGNVPLFAVLAESTNDIQKGVQFAHSHNLRIAIKSSGHDYLGRSTAKDSLLISTHKLQNITFTDSFTVAGHNKGAAVTVGSGVTLNDLYTAAGAQGRIVVGGSAATVVAAGGYVQGGGHSALSPLLGLAADNCLELSVVIANGTLLRANEAQNSDLYWALRGGGAGSWGVIVSATLQTFPTFDVAISTVTISTSSIAVMGNVIAAHAKHIFDWDSLHAGQYFYLDATIPTGPTIRLDTFFPHASAAQGSSAMDPLAIEARSLGAVVTSNVTVVNINQALAMPDDDVGLNGVLGSRLIPATVYRDSPSKVGEIYTELLNAGATNVLGHLVAGGKVAENANVFSAINPKWRTAKTHLIIANIWDDNTTVADVRAIETTFKDKYLPILQKLAGPESGAYSNEADVLEADFQTTFYGPNYAKLSAIKRRYDPNDLFIVGAGVGSERWDSFGLCKV